MIPSPSSVLRPRVVVSRFRVRHSGASGLPMPKAGNRRPSDNTSIVAHCLASNTGSRNARDSTLTPNLSRRVRPARPANGNSITPTPIATFLGILPSSLALTGLAQGRFYTISRRSKATANSEALADDIGPRPAHHNRYGSKPALPFRNRRPSRLPRPGQHADGTARWSGADRLRTRPCRRRGSADSERASRQAQGGSPPGFDKAGPALVLPARLPTDRQDAGEHDGGHPSRSGALPAALAWRRRVAQRPHLLRSSGRAAWCGIGRCTGETGAHLAVRRWWHGHAGRRGVFRRLWHRGSRAGSLSPPLLPAVSRLE